MRTFNKQVSTAQALNLNSNSPSVPLRNIYTYSIAAIITGTPTGSIKLQASNDPETNDTSTGGSLPTPTHWADIANSSTNVVAAGVTLWNVDGIGYNYVRVVYTDTSSAASTAVMDIVFNGKGV